MIDLTINEKDKNYYITKVELEDGYKTYRVTYANGREEVFPFSIHNYNVDIRRMEQQFYQYKDEYSFLITQKALEVLKTKLQKIVVALVSTVIVFQITDNHIIRMIAIILTLLDMVYNQIKSKSILLLCGTSLEYIKQIERYMEKKNEFVIPIINPKNNEKEEWYLLNLCDVENTIFQPEIYNEIASTLNEDVKKELSERITNELSGQSNDNDVYTFHK